MSHHCAKFKAGQHRPYNRFIKMCEKAKEIQKDHNFTEGNCFYHPEFGVGDVLRTRDKKITNTPDEAVDPPLSFSECTWLPTVEKLKEMADMINLTEEGLQKFLNMHGVSSLSTSPYRLYRPILYVRQLEEQWLAYYMFERHEKIWHPNKKDWISV